MSQRAILLAVRDHLRAELQLSDLQCQVMFDGQPPPACGEVFVSVHPGSWSGNRGDGDLDESLGVLVTATKRTTYAPADRVVSPLAGPEFEALDRLLERLRAKLHKDPPATGSSTHYPVLALANATIGATANGFIEPLVFRDGGRPEPKGAEWFSAEPGTGVCGLAQTLVFDGARRVQTVESQT